jgi:hypothetical protein
VIGKIHSMLTQSCRMPIVIVLVEWCAIPRERRVLFLQCIRPSLQALVCVAFGFGHVPD